LLFLAEGRKLARMARDANALLDEALQLPSEARARLAAELLRSLDDEEEPLDQAEYDAAWGAVIERRLREIESGAVKAVPWSEARRRILSDE
jgi:putative addiction module component (TIGR02574 family)